MLISSTKQSVARKEPTIAALAETLLAVAISVGIAIQYQTWAHLAIGACIAPLLLLRSSNSMDLGVRWFNSLKPKGAADDRSLSIGWLYLRVIVLSIIVRIAATARHPIKGIQNIPANWVQVVICTDLHTSVELVPGLEPAHETLNDLLIEDDYSGLGFLLFGSILCGMFAGVIHFGIRPLFQIAIWNVFFWLIEFASLFTAGALALGVLCYAIAYLYRLSLKSTAIVWLPLIYVIHVTFDKKVNLIVQLEEMRRAALWKLIRTISWVILALLAAKVVVLPPIIDWWNSQSWTKILNVYVMPNEIHPWHLATGLNAAITLLSFYYFFDPAPTRIREGIWNASAVLRGIQIFTMTRGVISIYTIFVGLYLTIVAAQSMTWPTWSGRLVPW